MNKVIIPSLFVMGALLAGGCQGNWGQANQSLSKDDGSPNSQFFGTRETGRKIRTNDMDNLNPNFLNLHGTRNGELSGNSQNQGKDVAKAKQVINNTREFTTDSVWISNSGDRMRVTVFKKGKLSKRDVNDAQIRLHHQLVRALPRYSIDITVLQDKR